MDENTDVADELVYMLNAGSECREYIYGNALMSPTRARSAALDALAWLDETTATQAIASHVALNTSQRKHLSLVYYEGNVR